MTFPSHGYSSLQRTAWLFTPSCAVVVLVVASCTLLVGLALVCTHLGQIAAASIGKTLTCGTLMLVNLSIVVCTGKHMVHSWQEYWKRREQPPHPAGLVEIHTRLYQHTIRYHARVRGWAECVEGFFARPYMFHIRETGQVTYVLYAKKGRAFLVSLPLIHAGISCLLCCLLLTLLPSPLRAHHNQLLFFACALSMCGCLLRCVPYQRLWLRFTELEGTGFCTVTYSSVGLVNRSEEVFSRIVASLEKMLRSEQAHQGCQDPRRR